MKKFYFIWTFVFALIISSGFAFAQVKPSNLNCKLAQNADNEWCEMEKGSYDDGDDIWIAEDEEMEDVMCDPFFTVTPKYKSYQSKYWADTKILQDILNMDNPDANLKVDGLWGGKTDKEFRAFQKRNEIKVTGLVDTATIDFLTENYCDATMWDEDEG